MESRSADETLFVHSPLSYRANAIRLVKLLPRLRPSDPIQCVLMIENLHPGLEFHALSYVWGRRSHNKILVDGYSFDVRDNLYHFLEEKSFDRDFCNNKRFWIDQICIDQENILERNHQVNQMALIYSLARRVHIWLGRERGASDGIMDDIKSYESPYRLSDGLQILPPADYVDTMSMCLQCFAYLSEAQYWNRLWIIQEILLSRSTSVIYGSRTIPWTQLEVLLNDILQYLHDEQRPVDDLVYAESLRYSNLARFILQRQKMRSGGKDGAGRLLDWYNIIELTRESRCTDIRDRVYGVLGVVDPSFRIPVDYDLPTEIICQQVLATYARHYLDSGRAAKAIASPLEKKETLEGFAEALGIALECSSMMSIQSRNIINREIEKANARSNGGLFGILGLPGLRQVAMLARQLREDERPSRRQRRPKVDKPNPRNTATEQRSTKVAQEKSSEVPPGRNMNSYSASVTSCDATTQTPANIPTISITVH